MALQAIKQGLPFPPWPTQVAGAPGLGLASFVLDAASEKAALIFAATAAKSIRTIHYRTGTVTTGDTLDVRVETVDTAANGDPTGTLWATNTNAASVVAGGDDSVWKSATLTADATLAIGDVVAIVLVNGGGGGNMQLAAYGEMVSGFPYGDLFTAAWAKSIIPMFVVEYSDGSFEPVQGFLDQGAPITPTTFNSGTATNRRGNMFQVPFPTRTNGCWVWVDADGPFTCTLYDSDGTTVLATTATINQFQRSTAAGNIAFYPWIASPSAAPSLLANTNYRIVVIPTSTTNLTTYDFDVTDADMLNMFVGGTLMHASVFTSSAWVETTTRRGYLGVMLDAFDDGAGSGGGANRALLPAGLSALG